MFAFGRPVADVSENARIPLNMLPPGQESTACWRSNVDEALDTELHHVAERGDAAEVKNLLSTEEGQASINRRNDYGCMPLHLAAAQGHQEVIRLLVRNKAKLNFPDVKAQTPVLLAVKGRHVGCVRILLEAGANPNGWQNSLCTPLYQAALDGSLEIVRDLVSHGADVDLSHIRVGLFVCTPLYGAIIHKRLDCFKFLLCSGADPNYNKNRVQKMFPGRAVQSFFHAVVKHKCPPEYAHLLMEFGADLHQRDEMDKTAADLHFKSDTVDYIKEMAATPLTLKTTCRLFIRGNLGKEKVSRLPELPLPTKLVDYLMYKPECGEVLDTTVGGDLVSDIQT
ncbi:Ankyrin Repeat [Branchiostoma belcheri]|nr:Ankyrin Repeat [Branchiostoma belcheri]